MKKSIQFNAIINGVKTLLLVAFPLITFPYAAKVIGVKGIGQYNFAYSIVSYFMLLAALGIYNYAVREGVPIRNDKAKFSIFASEILEFNIISAIISYFLLFAICAFWSKLHSYNYLIFVISINIVLTTFGCEWIYAIYEEYLYMAVRSIIFQIISMILLFTCVHSSDDLVVYSITTLVSLSGYNLLNIAGLHKKISFSFQPLKGLIKHCVPIMLLFANSIATTIYINSDTTILGILVGDYEVGLYSVATKVYSIVKSILASVIIVSIPTMSNLWSHNDRAGFAALGNKILNSFLTLTFPAMLGIYLLSNEIIDIIADSTYFEANVALRILSIALLVSVFNWFFQSSILIPSKKETKVLYASCAAAIINIVLNFILIPVYKQNAAAFTTLFAELVSVSISGYYALKIIKIKFSKKDVGSICFGCVFICFYFKITNFLVTGTLIRVAITIVGAFIGYFFILIIFKNSFTKDMLDKIKDKLCR